MLVFLYSLISYAIGVGSSAYLVGWMAGILPGAYGGPLGDTGGAGLAWNFGLLALFGIQHSLMARPGFKRWLTNTVPAAAERSTYVLMTGVVIFLMVGFWTPQPSPAWQVNGAPAVVLWILFAGGWLFMFAATFATNHFELFGLRQAWLHFRGRPYTELPFTRQGIYGTLRHPIQTGILIGIWCLPTMRTENLIMSMGITIYVFIGLWFEEKDLIANFGEDYQRYKAEVGGLVPKFAKNQAEN